LPPYSHDPVACRDFAMGESNVSPSMTGSPGRHLSFNLPSDPDVEDGPDEDTPKSADLQPRRSMCEGRPLGKASDTERPTDDAEEEAKSKQSLKARPRTFARKFKMLVFVGVLATCIIAGALHAKAIEEALYAFVMWCETLGYGAAALICLATALANLAMVPCFPLMLASGGLFANMYGPSTGMLVGTVAVFTGLWVGSMAAFALGRYAFADFAAHAAKESQLLSIVSGMIAMQGRRIVFLARMTPIIPGEVFNYACSAIPTLSAWDYGVGCIGSALPVSVWVGAGAQAESAAEGSSEGHSGSIMMSMNVVVMVVLFFEFRRAYNQYKESISLDGPRLPVSPTHAAHVKPASRLSISCPRFSSLCPRCCWLFFRGSSESCRRRFGFSKGAIRRRMSHKTMTV